METNTIPFDPPALPLGHLPAIGIAALIERQSALARRLAKFSFPLVAQALGGLLTRPDNHAATLRLEALLHLGAACSRGEREPQLADLRNWINGAISRDEIASMEDPIEDVFVSNTATTIGNACLFEGTWVDNDDHVQTCLAALLTIDRPWARYAGFCANALLRLSDAIASRAGLERFAGGDSHPRRPLTISKATVDSSSPHVRFTDADLAGIGVDREHLSPFVFQIEHAADVGSEFLGHTSLERRPLVRYRGETIVALPTAIGAATRRFILELALEDDGCAALQARVASHQFSDILSRGLVGWRIRKGSPQPFGTAGAMDFVATFDEGGYVHVVFSPDDIAASATGLLSVRATDRDVGPRIDQVSEQTSEALGFRRGLTIVVLGGVGRGAEVDMGKPRAGWRRLMLGLPDFMRLARDPDLDALRAWKLLDQQEALAARGIEIIGTQDFVALYAYAKAQDFKLVEPEVTEGLVWPACRLADLRRAQRRDADRHLAPSPRGTGFVEVERDGQRVFFEADRGRPKYVCLARLQDGVLSACVETARRAWWIECEDRPTSDRGVAIVEQVWRMALCWLLVVAPAVERTAGEVGPRAPVFMLCFPSVDEPIPPIMPTATPTEPSASVIEGRVVIECPAGYVASFARAENAGDAAMARALYAGACVLLGIPVPTGDDLHDRVRTLMGGDHARFFHKFPAHSISERVFASSLEQAPRLVAPEDEAWSRLGLARRAGWQGRAGALPSAEAGRLLHEAVVHIRDRIEDLLKTLGRGNVVEKALANHAAVARERAMWRLTAGALMALHADSDDVVRAFNEREERRALAGLSSRVVAEMALCMSPVGGPLCTEADFDRLLAEAATLLQCAGQSDALHYGVAGEPPGVLANGSFNFDGSFVADTQRPYFEAHGSRQFRAAASAYGDAYSDRDAAGEIDAGFKAAFVAEFGCDPTTYYAFVDLCGEECISNGSVQFRSTRSGVLELMREAGIARPEHTYERFTLVPRKKWDDPRPKGAKPSDWWPWRFNRRLSLVRRPIVQLDDAPDPTVLIAPTLIESGARHLCEAAVGRLPVDLFESEAMRSWIGRVVNLEGHVFNATVAAAMDALGWTTKAEVKMTMLGGDAALGDIDVLAWNAASGIVHVIECKRLMFARTIGEVGERLTEYATLAKEGARTPIQKHVDRIGFVQKHKNALAGLVGIGSERVQLRSALVTDYLVPMHFSDKALSMVDVVADVSSLGDHFPLVDTSA